MGGKDEDEGGSSGWAASRGLGLQRVRPRRGLLHIPQTNVHAGHGSKVLEICSRNSVGFVGPWRERFVQGQSVSNHDLL